MPGLTATGTLSYNGHVFDGASEVTVSTEYISRGLGRTITTHDVTITVTTTVASDSGVDSDLETIRRRLGQAGGKLIFTGRGFGNDLRVNAGGPITDLEGGPRPVILRWKPVGDNRAVEITWTVKTRIPVAATAGVGVARLGVLRVDYTVTWECDEFGDVTRTYNGTIEIAANRIGRDSASRYRHFFSPPLVPGFHRTQSWNMTANRLQANFTITDRQIKSLNPYPRGMIEASGTHRVTINKKDSAKQINTISGTLSPDPRLDALSAFEAFFEAINFRLDKIRALQNIHILSLDVEENIWDYPQSFSLKYQVTGSVTDFTRGGIWQPIFAGGGTSDWSKWRFSISDPCEDIEEDVQINFDGPTRVLSPEDKIERNRRIQRIAQRQKDTAFAARIRNRPPDENESFLDWRHRLEVIRSDRAKRQRILQKPQEDSGTGFDPSIGDVPSSFSTYKLPATSINDILQRSGVPSYQIRYSGMAERAGHPIPEPRVLIPPSATGLTAMHQSTRMFQEVTRNDFSLPVYLATWVVDVLLNRPPENVRPPANPAQFPGMPNAFGPMDSVR